jgi:hypothetical protein
MMYPSIFPEDYVISKDGLLHRWIARGLIPEKRGLTMLEVVESYFDELLSRNMIFSVQGRSCTDWYAEGDPIDYDGKLECCQVHDMLLEVMVSKSLEYNFGPGCRASGCMDIYTDRRRGQISVWRPGCWPLTTGFSGSRISISCCCPVICID